MVMMTEGDLIDIPPLQFFHISAMSLSEKISLKKKLKAELADVRAAIGNIWTEGKKSSAGSDCKGSPVSKYMTIVEECTAISETGCSNGNPQALTGKKRKLPEMNKQQKNGKNFAGSEILVAAKSETALTSSGASKGKTSGRLDDQCEKGQKMDTSKRRHCTTILKKLMTHKNGWVFNQPVDPVKLAIPDYFSIIARPMDLGTVKSKLESQQYSSTHQFAADVRLTFANAMQYNPPGNLVHNMAKELNDIFSSRWKMLEVSWRKECSMQQPVVNKIQKQVVTLKELQKSSALSSTALHKKPMTAAEKLKLRRDLAKLSIKDMPPFVLDSLQKACSVGRNEDTLDLDIDVLDDNTLWNLHQIVRSCLDVRCTQSADLGREFSHASVKSMHKGDGGNMLRHCSVKDKTVTSRSAGKNDTSGSMDQCCTRTDFTQSSSSDVDSERSSAYVPDSVASSQVRKRATTVSQMGNLNTVINGSEVVVDIENSQPNDHHPFPDDSFGRGKDDPPCEQQLSPSKALRAAIMKSRFADTILKAQQRTLLNHGEKGDPAKMQQEREKMEKKQKEEKARIEAAVKAAEAAARMKAEAELKAQREKEREAARLALQQMEQTVHIDENSRVLKDLEKLAYAQTGFQPDTPDEMVVNIVDGLELQSGHAISLEQLGLFMKEEDFDEEDGLQLQSGHVNPLEELGLFAKKEDPGNETADWLSPTGNGDVEEGLQLQPDHVNPLEQLGLFVKKGDPGEEAADWLTPVVSGGEEEGEIS